MLLVDLLWREHPKAAKPARRGPVSRISTNDVVAAAIAIADHGGLAAVRMRDVAAALGVSTMATYPHVNSREDLLVLMADAIHRTLPTPKYDALPWPDRVRLVAQSNLDLYRQHPWLLDITDSRLAVGPGTIAKYDAELHAFDGAGLDDVDRDAALTFVLDFVRSNVDSARYQLAAPQAMAFWAETQPRLAGYLGEGEFDLAGRVGQAAGEHMQSPYSAAHAYLFGIERVIAALTSYAATPKT